MKTSPPQRSIEERDKLFHDNGALIGFVMSRLRPEVKKALGGQADAEQIASLALLKASASFDESKGFAFSTYATCSIFRYLIRMAGELQAIRIPVKKYRDGLRQPMMVADGGISGRQIGVVDPEDVSLEPQEVQALRLAMEALPAINRTVIERKLWHDEAPSAYATRIGISKWGGCLRYKSGLKRLRKLLEDDDACKQQRTRSA